MYEMKAEIFTCLFVIFVKIKHNHGEGFKNDRSVTNYLLVRELSVIYNSYTVISNNQNTLQSALDILRSLQIRAKHNENVMN